MDVLVEDGNAIANFDDAGPEAPKVAMAVPGEVDGNAIDEDAVVALDGPAADALDGPAADALDGPAADELVGKGPDELEDIEDTDFADS